MVIYAQRDFSEKKLRNPGLQDEKDLFRFFLQFSLIPIFAAFICQAHKLGDWLGRKVDWFIWQLSGIVHLRRWVNPSTRIPEQKNDFYYWMNGLSAVPVKVG